MENRMHKSDLENNHAISPSSNSKIISPIREALPQIAAVCVKNVLLLAWGLTLGFITILIPGLSGGNPEEKIVLGQEAISWIGSLNLICVPLGCLLSGTVTQAVGRRRAMQIVNIPFLMSWLLFHFSGQVWQIFLALVLAGLSGGLLEAPVLTYVAEIAQPHLRGILSVSSAIAITVGTLIQFLLGTFLTWRTVALINCFIPVISIILLMFVPETPVWLISKNRLDEARKSIAWLRGWVNIEDIENEFQELYKQINSTANNNQNKTTIVDKLKMFKDKTFLWPYFLVSISFFLSHFNGCTPLGIYALKIFAVLKTPIDKYYTTVLMGSVQLLGCIMCTIFINIIGKRLISFISLVGTAICFIIVATHAYMHNILHFEEQVNNTILMTNLTINSTNYNSTAIEVEEAYWTPLSFLVLASFLTYSGIRSLPWILTGEVYPTEIRAFASGFSGGTGYIFNFISNKIFLSLVSSLTLPGVFWLYATLGVAGFIVLYFLLPETEGKSLFEVTEHFAGRGKLRNSIGRKKRFENGTINPTFVCDEKELRDTKL